MFFFHTHRETSILAGELPEESNQFHFLRSSRLVNLKDSVGLFPVPRFFNSRRPAPLLVPSLVVFPEHSDQETHEVCSFLKSFTGFTVHHSLLLIDKVKAK